MSQPQEIWVQHKRLLETQAFEEWGDLCAKDSQFVIAYGKEGLGEEAYKSRENILAFFSISRGKVKMYFAHDVLQATQDQYDNPKPNG